MTVFWSEQARERVIEIGAYLAGGNPDAAFGWINRIFEVAEERLELFPESGRIVPEIDDPNVRELIWKGWRIIYQVTPKQVVILTVRHGRQQWEDLEIPELPDQ